MRENVRGAEDRGPKNLGDIANFYKKRNNFTWFYFSIVKPTKIGAYYAKMNEIWQWVAELFDFKLPAAKFGVRPPRKTGTSDHFTDNSKIFLRC